MIVSAQYSQFTTSGGVEIPDYPQGGGEQAVPHIPYNNPLSYEDPTHYPPNEGDPSYLTVVTLLGPANGNLKLSRSNANINVWANPEGTVALLTQASSDHSEPIHFNSDGVPVVYVGWDGSVDEAEAGSEVTLALAATQNDLARPVSLKFIKSEVLIIGIAGHTQSLDAKSVTTHKIKPSSGTYQFYKQVVTQYNAMVFPKNPGNLGKTNTNEDGTGGSTLAVPFIPTQVNKHGVTTIGLYGYSHGGGTVYEVSQLLAAAQNNPRNNSFTLAWTAYVDAVDVRSGLDSRPELHLPVGINYHYTIYQSKDGFIPDPNDYPIEGADVRAIAWRKLFRSKYLGRYGSSILTLFRHFSFLSRCQ